MTYKLVGGANTEMLELNVKFYLSQGWILHAGPFMAHAHFYQAMTKVSA